MVLAGRLFPIDNRCSLYLAVFDILLDGERVEGVGVAPDVEVQQDALSSGKDLQLDRARAILADKMRANAKRQ
jgi:carboxyl-terminal processing protease